MMDMLENVSSHVHHQILIYTGNEKGNVLKEFYINHVVEMDQQAIQMLSILQMENTINKHLMLH
jgi:hypothetical protein